MNYVILHYCVMGGHSWISVPVLVGVLILAFYILAETAENYFSPVVRKLVEVLGLTPSVGGVTLLALGNGAPDMFASFAAIGGDNSRIGFSAILSAGTFVSAFVVGSVALAAAPFSVRPMPFVRDVLFYFGAVCFLFIFYLKGEIIFWQAGAMVFLYVLFVVVVICTDHKELESEGMLGKFSGSMQITDSIDNLKDVKEGTEEPEHVEDVTEDHDSNGAVRLVVSSPNVGETGAIKREMMSRFQELFTIIHKRLGGYSETEEVCMRCEVFLLLGSCFVT